MKKSVHWKAEQNIMENNDDVLELDANTNDGYSELLEGNDSDTDKTQGKARKTDGETSRQKSPETMEVDGEFFGPFRLEDGTLVTKGYAPDVGQSDDEKDDENDDGEYNRSWVAENPPKEIPVWTKLEETNWHLRTIQYAMVHKRGYKPEIHNQGLFLSSPISCTIKAEKNFEIFTHVLLNIQPGSTMFMHIMPGLAARGLTLLNPIVTGGATEEIVICVRNISKNEIFLRRGHKVCNLIQFETMRSVTEEVGLPDEYKQKNYKAQRKVVRAKLKRWGPYEKSD